MKKLMAIVFVVGLVGLAACGDDSSSVGAEAPTLTRPDATPTTTALPSTTAVVATLASPPPTTAPTTEPPPATCSAAGLAADLPAQAALPEAVAVTRQAIVDAAIACDWGTLRELTAVAGEEFVYSFGGGNDPVTYWQSYEPDPSGPLRAMVIVLRAPFRTFDSEGGSGFAWPEAFHADPLTDAHRAPLAELYSEDDFAAFRDFGGYVGWRVGIDPDGTWRFFVAGD